jgi:hypothetical protein
MMSDTHLLYDIEQDTKHNSISMYSPNSNSSSNSNNLSLSPISAQLNRNRSNSRSPSSERANTTSCELINVLNGKKEVIPQRKRRDFIPNELKDEHYWERRRKNNLAAKRSREKRRLNDIVLETKVLELTNLNNSYKLKLDLLMKKYNVDDNEMDKLFEENRHLLVITETIEGMIDDDTSEKLVSIKNTSSSTASSNGNTSDHSCDDHQAPPPNKILKSAPKELLFNQVKNEFMQNQYPLLYNQLCKTMLSQRHQQQHQEQNDQSQSNKISSSNSKVAIDSILNDNENSNQILLNNQIEKYKNLINKINTNVNARLIANSSRKRHSNDYLNDNSNKNASLQTQPAHNSILMENINRLFLLNQHLHNTALTSNQDNHNNGKATTTTTNTNNNNNNNSNDNNQLNAFNQNNTNTIDSNMPLKLRFKMLQLKAGEVN